MPKNEVFFHHFDNPNTVHECEGYIKGYYQDGIKIFKLHRHAEEDYEGEWEDYTYLKECVFYETNEELLCVSYLVRDIANREDLHNFPEKMSGYHQAKALYRNDRLQAYQLISQYGYGLQFFFNDLIYDHPAEFNMDWLNFYDPPKNHNEGQLHQVVFGGKETYEYGTNAYYWKVLQSFIRASEKEIKEVTKKLQTIPYKEFLQTLYWKAVSWQVKVISNFKCHICGSQKNLEAHHVTYNNRGYEFKTWKNDLICICKNCHSLLHEKEGAKIKRPS